MFKSLFCLNLVKVCQLPRKCNLKFKKESNLKMQVIISKERVGEEGTTSTSVSRRIVPHLVNSHMRIMESAYTGEDHQFTPYYRYVILSLQCCVPMWWLGFKNSRISNSLLGDNESSSNFTYRLRKV